MLSKKQRRASKKASERNQNLSGKGKKRSINVLENNVEIVLHKKKKKRLNIWS